MTQKEVADQMARCGIETSACNLGRIERNEVDLSYDEACALADIFGCSLEYFRQGSQVIVSDRRFHEEMEAMTRRERETFLYAKEIWEGDIRALFEWIRLYISIPAAQRQTLAWCTIHKYKCLQKAHPFRPGLDVNLELLEKKCKEIV